MKKIAYTIALMLVLVGSAFAQMIQTTPYVQSDDGLFAGATFNEQMSGVEAAPGTIDLEDNVTWGTTITMRGDTSAFTANINSDGVRPDLQNGNRIIGGTWSLTVYKAGTFKGMLFGEFIGGSITYKTDRAGNIVAEYVEGAMVVKGGTGDFANASTGSQSSGKFLSTSYPNTASTEPASHIQIHNGQVDLRF
ncbi:MAG TPA: hypothetical protein VGC91_07690 [Pyrinomonadaceae bacterium]|jgi:hypothetical protein